MIYVYALTDPLDSPPSDERGLRDAPLESVVEGDVGAAFSACVSSPAVEPENLWCHEAVAEALMRVTAVLPTRFGTTMTDPQRLRAVLARNTPVIRAGLDRVRGCVEVGVRVLSEGIGRPPEADQPGRSEERAGNGAAAGGAGRAYLVRRLAEERRQRTGEHDAGAAAEAVHASLAPIARGAVRRAARGPGTFTAAYLVDRDHLDPFVAAVADLDRGRSDRQVLCTGPWPPYSFVPTLELEGSPRG